MSKDLEDVNLVDFNTARNLREGLALTPTGARLYAAPEVIFGESPSEFSDVWAVGLCAHLLLCGKLPQDRDRCRSGMESVQACAQRTLSFSGPHWARVSNR